MISYSRNQFKWREIEMFADYHVHTEFSEDSVYPMENVIKDAIHMGMEEICITDHVDYGVRDDQDSGKELPRRDGKVLANVDYPSYMEKLECLKKQYGGRIKIRTGMEFGMQIHTIPQFQKLFARYPFDFIILSVHQIEDQEFWTQDFQKGRTQKEYNERYYEEMLSLVRNYKDYSVLGHMDVIKRYDKAGTYPYEKVKPLIEEILRIVIADGKGIEVNTSSRRYGLDGLMPSEEILRLYREMGGEIITIGSDSHEPVHLGTYIKETKMRLKGMGFRYFCTYDKMKPVFHGL